MWTRSLLKQNAWNQLKGYYWTAFWISLLGGLLTGILSITITINGEEYGFSRLVRDLLWPFLPQGMLATNEGYFLLVALISSVSSIISIAYSIFIGNPVICGKNRYYVHARNGYNNSDLFYYFKQGRYLNAVKVMFWRDLFVFLWSLLLIVPGIIKAYEYALVPYLLADNPRLSKERALEISKKAMDGEKWKLFVLQISFLGWFLLGALACGIGMLFVLPYPEATIAEFYTCMKAKMLAYGIASEE